MASNTKTPFENLYKPPDGKIDVPEFVNYLKENTPYLVSMVICIYGIRTIVVSY